jgi:hypothetical protein
MRKMGWMLAVAVLVGAWGVQAASAADTPKSEPAPTATSGAVTGVITEKGEGWLRVKDAGGASERYTAQWVGGMPADGGGLDKAMVKQIAERRVGDKVELKWVFVERKRVVELKLLEAAPAETPKPAPTGTSVLGDAKSGTFAGTVSEKGENWIRVKTADGKSERFMPRWVGGMPADGGGLDKDMLRIIAAVKVGDKVEVKFVVDERPRVVELKVVESAPAETPKPAAK